MHTNTFMVLYACVCICKEFVMVQSSEEWREERRGGGREKVGEGWRGGERERERHTHKRKKGINKRGGDSARVDTKTRNKQKHVYFISSVRVFTLLAV